MISLQSIASGKRAAFLLLALLVAALLLLPESRQESLLRVGRQIAVVVAVPLRVVDAANQELDTIWTRYLALQHAREESQGFRQQIARLQEENARLRESAAATSRLRDLLELKEHLPYPTLAAQVIGRDPTNWYRSVIINKGAKEGLTVDMGVLSPAGVVGRIVKVYDHLSIVLLIIDQNNAVTGLVQRTRDEGIVEGTERGLARIKYLPLLSTVKVGDQVVTSGLAGGFPRGLPVGTITKIERREAELFLSAEIAPDGDFTKIDEVLIITLPRETAQLPATPFPLQPPASGKRDAGDAR
ncbi:MAG TPA: rod shape-determining protein MreC [Nitrospirales bacterium]|jgi:rod shape-determining protein MreC|nr:rod shape-determining protein MreC [Nitrospirales bacterium]